MSEVIDEKKNKQLVYFFLLARLQHQPVFGKWKGVKCFQDRADEWLPSNSIFLKKEHNEKSRVGTEAKEATFSSKSARGWFISASALELQKKERDTHREKERI